MNTERSGLAVEKHTSLAWPHNTQFFPRAGIGTASPETPIAGAVLPARTAAHRSLQSKRVQARTRPALQAMQDDRGCQASCVRLQSFQKATGGNEEEVWGPVETHLRIFRHGQRASRGPNRFSQGNG